MSNGIIAFLVAIGASVWIYSKLMRSTGGNVKNAVTASAVAGVLIFVLALILASMLPG